MSKLLPVKKALFGAVFSGLAASAQVQAIGLDFSFSDQTANLESFAPFNRLMETGGQASLGIFYNDLDDVVAHGKLVAVGTQTEARIPYQLTFGGKIYLGKLDEYDVDIGALGIGGAISMQFPSSYNPIDLTVEGFFTPGITTFGDTETLIEVGARLSVEIVPQAKAFLGYRLLEIDDDSNRSLELDDNLHLGIRLQF